jgi:predicted RNA-binding protein with PUA-like domain
MHKYNKLFFSVLIFLAACSGNKVPDGIIGQNEMTNLLTDIHIVDGSMYNVMQTPDSLYKYGTDKYRIVFSKYHTDSLQFKKSFQYYSSKPDKLQAIYEQITINIKQKSDSVNKLNLDKIAKDNKRRTDSLNKLPKQAQPKPVTPQPVQPVIKRNFNPNIKLRKKTNVDSLK